MGPWSDWNACSEACDYGTKRRDRSCSGPMCQQPQIMQVEYCFEAPCGGVTKGKSHHEINCFFLWGKHFAISFFLPVMTFRPTLVTSPLFENTTHSIDLLNFQSFPSKKLHCASACNAMKTSRQDTRACNAFFFSLTLDECHVTFIDLSDILLYNTGELREVFLDADVS